MGYGAEFGFIPSEYRHISRVIIAIFVSLVCHIFCFYNIELTFDSRLWQKKPGFSNICFLGPILQEFDYHRLSVSDFDYRRVSPNIGMLPEDKLSAASLPTYNELNPDTKKPSWAQLIDNKVLYFIPLSAPETKKLESSIIFSPLMPYHFLLYFKDQQTAHVEVEFYISPTGKIEGIRRKVSSGNPEVDLLIMRNLTHFLNVCKSNFTLGSWQTVKIDLSP